MPIISRGATRCPTCSRSKDEAIAEQVRKKKVCDCANCIFHDEIEDAIANVKKIKITKKETPKITIRRK